MKRLFFICLLFTICSIINADDEYEAEEGVIDLKEANFDEAVAKFKFLLVEFCKLDFFCLL
jgi:hypothetical protein